MCFRWNVGLPTAAHFSEYYFQHATDGIPAEGREEIEKYKTYISKYMHYFLEISMQGMIEPLHIILSKGLNSSKSKNRFYFILFCSPNVHTIECY